MTREDLERLIGAIQASSEEVYTGHYNEIGDAIPTSVINTNDFERELQKWMKEIETKEKVARMIELDENE